MAPAQEESYINSCQVPQQRVCALQQNRCEEPDAAHREYNEKVATAKKVAATLIAGAQAIYTTYQMVSLALIGTALMKA